MNEITFTHIPQLSAHNSGIIVIPATITHCSPHSIDADLNPASTLYWSISQTKCFISATLVSYEENYICSLKTIATWWQINEK